MKTYQPKVNNTQKYSDNQGKHIVHPAKLILIDYTLDRESFIKLDGKYKYPIIISETEVEAGDWIYDISRNSTFECSTIVEEAHFRAFKDRYKKVLALPEHFSDKHLQAIVDGKMKSEDKVWVKCQSTIKAWDDVSKTVEEAVKQGKMPTPSVELNRVYLNQNHITLFPAKQSLEEASKEYKNNLSPNYLGYYDYTDLLWMFRKGAEWAKKNNY